ncbi:MAG TPA: hypothetical protein VF618_23670 [Thermoanaerobaculia bacterium]
MLLLLANAEATLQRLQDEIREERQFPAHNRTTFLRQIAALRRVARRLKNEIGIEVLTGH